MPTLHIRKLGIQDYQTTLTMMQLFTKNRYDQTPDECWFTEHYPTYTLGQNGDMSHLLQTNKIPVLKSDRGGNITYHGKGQLVGYIMMDLKRKKLDIHQLVNATEEVLRESLATFGVAVNRIPDAPGLYIQGEKVCSLGFRIKKFCSYHGFALNLDMDLQPFSDINPCGLEGMTTTNVQCHVQNIAREDLMSAIIISLMQQFGYTQYRIK